MIFPYFHKFFVSFMACAVILALSSHANCANIAAAGIDEGYAGKALDKIMKKWPASLSGIKNARIQILIDASGQCYDCLIRQSSGHAATDKAICAAVKSASPFGTPPYAQPAEVSLAIQNLPETIPKHNQDVAAKETPKRSSPETAAPIDEKQKKYLEKITRELRNSVYIPEQSKPGTYYPVARISLDKNGKITNCEIVKSSGDKIMDKYLAQGIKRAGKASAPPADLKQPVDLTFRLIR